MQGWLKFYIYSTSTDENSISTRFEFNPSYSSNSAIPSDHHFYFLLTMKTLYSLYSDQEKIVQTFKTFELEWIKNDGYQIGIEEMPINYGFCFKLSSNFGLIWRLCANNNNERNMWLGKIKELVLEIKPIVEKKNNYENNVLQKTNIIIKRNNELEIGNEIINENNKIEKENKWIILHKWSRCNKKCGGGKQYLQRICNTGIGMCKGKEILKRSCNKKKCKKNKKQIHFRQKAVIYEIFNERFEICTLKQGNLMLDLDETDSKIREKVNILVTLVLNDKTATIFWNDKYDSIYLSFDLPYLSLKIYRKDHCFLLYDIRDLKKQAKLCVFPYSLSSDQSLNEKKREWITQINFFKTKCNNKEKYIEINNNNINNNSERSIFSK